jgi:Uma2 family endonuclease
MSVRTREYATYEDLLKVPENMVGELIDGELYASPRPRGKHTNAASALGGLLVPPFQFGTTGPGGWWIQDEPELHLGENVIVPDLGGWRVERMPAPPEDHIYAVRPDWVCEVLSPSTARLDRGKKLPIYARHGIPWAWLVDVDAQYVEVKRLHNGAWTDFAVFTAGEPVRAEPFAEIEIDMTYVWGAPPA